MAISRWEGRYPVPKNFESMDKAYKLWREIAKRPIKIGTLSGYRNLQRNPMDWGQFRKLRENALYGYIQAAE
jgi:hypothetical protein